MQSTPITFGGPKPQATSASSSNQSRQAKQDLGLEQLPEICVSKIDEFFKTSDPFQRFQDLHALKSTSKTVKQNLEQDSTIQQEYQSLHSELENRVDHSKDRFSQNLHLYGPKHRNNLVNAVVAMQNGQEEDKTAAIEGLGRNLSALSEIDRNRLVDAAMEVQNDIYKYFAIRGLQQSSSALTSRQHSRLMDAANSIVDRALAAFQQQQG